MSTSYSQSISLTLIVTLLLSTGEVYSPALSRQFPQRHDYTRSEIQMGSQALAEKPGATRWTPDLREPAPFPAMVRLLRDESGIFLIPDPPRRRYISKAKNDEIVRTLARWARTTPEDVERFVGEFNTDRSLTWRQLRVVMKYVRNVNPALMARVSGCWVLSPRAALAGLIVPAVFHEVRDATKNARSLLAAIGREEVEPTLYCERLDEAIRLIEAALDVSGPDPTFWRVDTLSAINVWATLCSRLGQLDKVDYVFSLLFEALPVVRRGMRVNDDAASFDDEVVIGTVGWAANALRRGHSDEAIKLLSDKEPGKGLGYRSDLKPTVVGIRILALSLIDAGQWGEASDFLRRLNEPKVLSSIRFMTPQEVDRLWRIRHMAETFRDWRDRELTPEEIRRRLLLAAEEVNLRQWEVARRWMKGIPDESRVGHLSAHSLRDLMEKAPLRRIASMSNPSLSSTAELPWISGLASVSIVRLVMDAYGPMAVMGGASSWIYLNRWPEVLAVLGLVGATMASVRRLMKMGRPRHADEQRPRHDAASHRRYRNQLRTLARIGHVLMLISYMFLIISVKGCLEYTNPWTWVWWSGLMSLGVTAITFKVEGRHAKAQADLEVLTQRFGLSGALNQGDLLLRYTDQEGLAEYAAQTAVHQDRQRLIRWVESLNLWEQEALARVHMELWHYRLGITSGFWAKSAAYRDVRRYIPSNRDMFPIRQLADRIMSSEPILNMTENSLLRLREVVVCAWLSSAGLFLGHLFFNPMTEVPSTVVIQSAAMLLPILGPLMAYYEASWFWQKGIEWSEVSYSKRHRMAKWVAWIISGFDWMAAMGSFPSAIREGVERFYAVSSRPPMMQHDLLFRMLVASVREFWTTALFWVGILGVVYGIDRLLISNPQSGTSGRSGGTSRASSGDSPDSHPSHPSPMQSAA